MASDCGRKQKKLSRRKFISHGSSLLAAAALHTHYIENIGDGDLIFLDVFPTPYYEDISLSEWLAHTPSRLVNQHIGTGEEFLRKINGTEAVVTPE